MVQLEGYEHGSGVVCKLEKALYGLKQAPRAWYLKLSSTLFSFGFTSTTSDPCLFVRSCSISTTYLLAYVDDILVTGTSATESLSQQLHAVFTLKDLGEMSFFLGVEVVRDSSDSLPLKQSKYFKKLLGRANMPDAKPVPTPMLSSPKLTASMGSPFKIPHYIDLCYGNLDFTIDLHRGDKFHDTEHGLEYLERRETGTDTWGGKKKLEHFMMKKQSKIDAIFKRKAADNVGVQTSQPSNLISQEVQVSELSNLTQNAHQHESKVSRLERDVDISLLERDPGKRRLIWQYNVNERDKIRRAYIIAGPYQPTNISYPASGNNNHRRYFQSSWFKKFPSWLEYSPEKDAAYCLPCYLFSKHYGARNDGKNAFSELGFSNWKKVNNGVNCAFVCHEGSIPNSPHNLCVKSCDDLMAHSKHIDKVLDRNSDETIANNRLRLKTSIDDIRWLAFQACAFRGDDESPGSLNRGNFIELIKLLASCNQNVNNVVLENAPGNTQYISPSVQKDILHIFARKVRATIREEIGDSKFCIIIDEARDESKQEQMSVVLRFVDKHGCVQERFFDLIHVSDTCSLTLKTEISSVLSRHNLDVQNLRGQGYDGASNMRGEWNGLQALFLKDCPFAYYIHCLAHRLQLALVSAAKEVCYVHQFFSKLTLIVNVVTVSPKRHDQLRVAQANNVANLIANDQIVTGSGLNQIGTLQRAGDTRWGSHLNSVRSLLCMFDATCEVLEKSSEEGNFSTRGDASAAYDAITSFEFVFVLHLMRNILEVSHDLCQALQRKNQDILNALTLVSTTKTLIQRMRESSWEAVARD
ncbi:uncharacterized protein LOC130957341 [Arachis stenosperma]|uniref:uncharacterized protein LOC130957341 n=1 Tax=Arachis stenosperma TaxID=217475 RepID=UPI0025AC646B|nr:uncharacterized protein LOC130957341 [Arachis stenosperma]